jgi:hypothetical protein
MTNAASTTTGGANPAAFHWGPGHVIVYGNPAFLAAYGPTCLGLPAREALLDLPPEAFELMDHVLREGRALARRLQISESERRLVVVPRRDPEGEAYGLTTHLVAVAAATGP